MSKVKRASMRAVVRPTRRQREAADRAREAARLEIRVLDPVAKCGAGTSVQRLYRVIERTEAGLTNHLVFLDRHGWYCEHGRSCHAVRLARSTTAR